MPAIFTGEYPTEGSEELTNRGEWTSRHLSSRETITEAFERAGYDTAGFTPNGFTSRFFGYDEGFDYFQDFFDEEYRPDRDLPNVVRGIVKLIRREEKFKPWETYYDEILEWIEQASEPYFLWVMLMDTHSPFYAPGASRVESSWWEMLYANWRFWQHGFGDLESDYAHTLLRKAYDDTIRYADEFLARIQSDFPGNPVTVVHADHGEGLGEHDTYGHGHTLYEENIHVPFVIGNVDTASIEQPVSLRQLHRVLQAIRNTPEDIASNLEDILPKQPAIARTLGGSRVAVRSNEWKLIRSDSGDELYNLVNDATETKNRTNTQPDIHQALASIADTHRSADREKRTIRMSVDELPL